MLDLSVLRIGAFELVARPDVPVAVVIDEAVELAKRFSTDDSGRFVNGVLSALADDLRPAGPPRMRMVRVARETVELDEAVDGASRRRGAATRRLRMVAAVRRLADHRLADRARRRGGGLLHLLRRADASTSTTASARRATTRASTTRASG